MIKENSNDSVNASDKGVIAVTERMKKSRIFSNKNSRIDRVTFTF